MGLDSGIEMGSFVRERPIYSRRPSAGKPSRLSRSETKVQDPACRLEQIK